MSQSVVWNYFGNRNDDIDQKQVLCRECLAIVQQKGSTTNLFSHLIRRHNALYNKCIKLNIAIRIAEYLYSEYDFFPISYTKVWIKRTNKEAHFKILHSSTHSRLFDSRHDDRPWWVGSCGTSWGHNAPCSSCCTQRWWGFFFSRTGPKEQFGPGSLMHFMHKQTTPTHTEEDWCEESDSLMHVVMLGDTVAQWIALEPHSQTVLGSIRRVSTV